MAISRIYSVKDELTGKFLNPFFIGDSETTEQEAIRIFKNNINNISIWKDNSQDFSLYQIGAMDDTTGHIIGEADKIIGGRAVLNE